MPEDSLMRIAPDLSEALSRSSDACLRRVAAAVCKLAVERSGLDAPQVQEVLRLLESNNTVPDDLTTRLKSLAEELDDRYLDLYGEAPEGSSGDEGWLSAFRKAKAAAALVFACEPNASFAATESAVEANEAIGDDIATLRRTIRTVLAAASST